MKLTKLLFVVACLLGLVAGGFAQNAETKETRGTFGYLDSKTGVFHRLTRTPLPAEAPAITPTTGKFVFNVTITVSSALPTTAAIGCSVFGGVDDLTSGAFSNSVSHRDPLWQHRDLHAKYPVFLGSGECLQRYG